MATPALLVTLGALAYYAYQRLFSTNTDSADPFPDSLHPDAPVHRPQHPASNADASYYPRTPRDIEKVLGFLVTKLPPELVLDILDHAEYWVRETVERNDRIVVAEPSAGTAYLRTWPILWASGGAASNSPPYPGTSLSFDDLPHDAPSSTPPPASPIRNLELGSDSEHEPDSPYPLDSDSKPGPVHEITFTLVSRDQGWSGQRQHHGTYEASYTWFEVRVVPPSAPPSGSEAAIAEFEGDWRHHRWLHRLTDAQVRQWRPRKLQYNVHASPQAKKHVVTWRADAEDEEERKWVRGLRQGECVEITLWAQYPGWANHVQSARIDVLVKG